MSYCHIFPTHACMHILSDPLICITHTENMFACPNLLYNHETLLGGVKSSCFQTSIILDPNQKVTMMSVCILVNAAYCVGLVAWLIHIVTVMLQVWWKYRLSFCIRKRTLNIIEFQNDWSTECLVVFIKIQYTQLSELANMFSLHIVMWRMVNLF